MTGPRRTEDTWFALYPYGGGGVNAYRPLWPLLGTAHRHLPVLAGRDGRRDESPVTSFDELADDLWQQLQPDIDARSGEALILFGYSLGAMVAFEMAVRLEARGIVPRGLVVGGAAAPDRWRPTGISDLPEDEFVSRMHRLGIAPAALLDDDAARAMFMGIWRADARVAESVRPRARRVRCPVHAVAGNRDPLADAEDLAAWERAGGRGSRHSLIGGDHGTLITNPVLMARTLRQAAEARSAA